MLLSLHAAFDSAGQLILRREIMPKAARTR
jgi:hypothetical protein